MSAKDDATDDGPAQDQPSGDGPTEEAEPETDAAASDEDQGEPDDTAKTEEPDTEDDEAEEPEPAPAATGESNGDGGGLTSLKAWLKTAPVWQVGVVAVVVAALAAEIFGSGIGRAIGVPMEAPQGFGEDEAEKLPVGSFVMATTISGVVGILLAMLLAWKASKPAKLWVIITVVLTVVSFASPITAEDTTTATKVVLALSHVVVAAIAIPLIYVRLAELERSKATA